MENALSVTSGFSSLHLDALPERTRGPQSCKRIPLSISSKHPSDSLLEEPHLFFFFKDSASL